MPPAISLDRFDIDPPVLLAPMAGVTDAPFRRLAASFRVGDARGVGLVCSEMVASRALVAADQRMQAKAALADTAGLTAVQLAARDPETLAEAARIAEGLGAPIIDLNMGCPAKKVTGGYAGAALMREPDLALRLIEAARAAVSVPITVKMRLGWDADCLTAPEIAARAEAAGVSMITVHGRTRRQFYKGEADWRAIAAVVERVAIPVVANGDIVDAASARRALALSGAAGVMIGRATQYRPWLLAEIAAALVGAPFRPPNYAEQADGLIRQHREMLALYGVDIGLRAARKHLGWRLAALPGGDRFRAVIMRFVDPEAVEGALRAAFAAAQEGGQGRSAA